jgi:hypothetical protein
MHMKVRKTLLVAAGLAGQACAAHASAPTMTVSVPPPAPTTSVWERLFHAPPTNLWDVLTAHDRPATVTSRPEPVVVVVPPPPAPKPAPVVVVPLQKPETMAVATPAIAEMTKPAVATIEPQKVMLEPTGPSPYYATAITAPARRGPSEPLPPAVSSYHPTSVSPLSPMTVARTGPAMSPYNAVAAATPVQPPPLPPPPSTSAPTVVANAAPAPLPTPVPFPTPVPIAPPAPLPTAVAAPAPLPAPIASVAPTPLPTAIERAPASPLSTKPLPVPSAPVVPAALNSETVEHLLRSTRADNPLDVRKESIRELARIKVKTPEVMVALDGLSDDPDQSLRAEAIIAAARLRMGQ